MCNCTHEYNEFAPRTIGGPSGDYSMLADVVSSEWVEFRILSIAEGDAGPGTIIVTGKGVPKALMWDGSVTLNDNSSAEGTIFRIGSTISVPITPTWVRVVHSQKRVFMRLDIPANTSCYVTFQFRSKILTRIPGPAMTVHPAQEHMVHQARSRRIEEAVLGREGEIKEYGERPAKGGTVRSLQTGRVIEHDYNTNR